ncbi:MAG: MFS transporter [Deltaproteobacteria bacterium]|nr:MFS transporter [Deltaproteobacteria bacterium]
MTDAPATAVPFPRTFWTANTTELFERAAYYSMASFVVIYLGRLGLGDYWPSNLNGLLWFLVYFLPILSGTIADRVGFRRALLVAFVLLAIGYFLMGYPVWFGGLTLAPVVSQEITAGVDTVVPVVMALLLIGVGGSVIKPCISGTVQKTHAGRATLAFAIFYMVINIGSLVGRVVAYFVRSAWADLSLIFAVALGASVVAFFVVLALYRDVEAAAPATPTTPTTSKTSLGAALVNMVLVLKSGRFVLFLLVSSGFWFVYNQVYNVLPLYVKRVVELSPAMDLYTAANPVTIVVFQLLITRLFGKLQAIRSIVVGTVIIGLSMVINLYPLFAAGGLRAPTIGWLPLGSLFIMLTVSLIAFGELFTSPRTFEWVGALAPKGQEGLFLGYVNLPMAIGSLVGGPVGAYLFNDVICEGAVLRADGLLELDPVMAARGWLILMAVGFASAASMWAYTRWLQRQPAVS